MSKITTFIACRRDSHGPSVLKWDALHDRPPLARMPPECGIDLAGAPLLRAALVDDVCDLVQNPGLAGILVSQESRTSIGDPRLKGKSLVPVDRGRDGH